MNSELKPYKDYKETGLFWINKIPRHWEWLYLSQVCEEQQVKNSDNVINNVLSLSYGNIIRKKNIDFGLVPKEYNNYQIINSGNIILRLTDLQNDKRSLRTGLVKETGIITSAYVCLKMKRGNNPSFVHYLLHSFDTIKVFYGMGGGVRQSIGFNDIRKLRLPIPSRTEQDQIVQYLDWQLARINKFIKTKKKLIIALKEQKQAVINAAVTKGINADVEMKPSGVKWLGDIPKHWEVMMCKRLLTLLTDYTANGSFGDLAKNVTYLDSGYARLIRLTDLRTNLTNKGVYVSEHSYNYLKKSSLFGGEFLIANVGAHTGYACVMPNVDFPTTLAPNMMMAKFNEERVLTNFIVEAFNCNYIQTQIKIKANNTAAQPKINKDDFKQVILAIPDIEEQQQIIRYIVEETKTIDKSILSAEQEINLITEYRTRLIFDVVTGQVDVRDIDINININELLDETDIDVDDEVVDSEECEV